MKIRTDFVTNSSSSSFISIKVITKEGQKYIAELDSGDTDIDAEVHDGTFRVAANEFESIDIVSDLFDKVYNWFYDSLNDPACGIDEKDEVFGIYGSGDTTEIRSLRKEDIHYVAVFSREEFCDEPWGASWVGYDYVTKAFDEEHRDEDVYSDQKDCYGESLYERFLSEDELKINTDTAKTNVSTEGNGFTVGEITWTVITVDGSNTLILADKPVGKQAYNKQCEEVTWETCTLRKWLNEDYYNNLSEAERSMIVEVENDNPDNVETGVSGGNRTKDKVFILSLDEVNDYLPKESDRAIGDYWWIRTPAEDERQALVIQEDGSILTDDGWVDFKYCVRPAMWIKQ